MSQASTTQVTLDGAAVCLSAACLIHCLALPVLISVAPWIVPGVFADERFHLWAVALALPLSLVGIGLGVRVHRHAAVIALAGAGLLALISGALWAEEGWPETALSVAGAGMLAGAHLLNFRLRRSAGTRS